MSSSPSGAATKAIAANDIMSVVPDIPWHKQKHLVRLNIAILFLVFFSSTNGYDGSMTNGIIALDQWNEFMGSPTGSYLGLINAMYSLGCVVAYPTSAWLSNIYGRKKILAIGYLFVVLGALLQTFCHNEATYIVSRLLLGFSGGAFLPAPLLIAENAYPTHRATLSSLYNSGWYAGSVVAAWVVFATRNIESNWSWRIPSALQMALPLLTIPGFLMIDESPRWLVMQGRSDEARAILAKNHAGGDETHPLVIFEMNEIETALAAEKAHGAIKWSSLWATPGNRKRLWITVSLGIYTQWVGNGVVSYYLSLVLETVGITSVTNQTLISAFLQLWNLIWASAAAFNTDRIGRRPLFLFSGAVMLVSYIVITGLSGSFATTGNKGTGLAVIPFLFVYFFAYDVGLTPTLIAYPVEIWQYSHRAMGLSVALLTSLGCVFFNTFVNPIALDALGWKYYFVFVAVLIAFIVTVYYTYPETRGRTLEAMAIIFDGDDAVIDTPKSVPASPELGGPSSETEDIPQLEDGDYKSPTASATR